MGIAPKTETIFDGVGDISWLGSAHGLDSADTATFDVALFTKATHYPKGYLRSGTPVGKVTASGRYGPYDNTAEDGREKFVGFIVGDYDVTGQTLVQGGIHRHGEVREAHLPIAIDAAAKADVAGQIWFV